MFLKICICHLAYECYIYQKCYPSLSDHPKNIWERVQIMKFLIPYFSPFSSYVLSLRLEYFPHTFFLKYPQYPFFPLGRNISYETTGKITFRQESMKQNIIKSLVASILRI